jgi:putative two-component system response regulator
MMTRSTLTPPLAPAEPIVATTTGQPTARILVAEDDPDVQNLVRYILEAEAYAVKLCSDGEQALISALQEPPDLLILDIMMPRLSGFEVLKRLRATGLTEPPVLFLSARRAESDIVAGFDLGAADYVTKPFMPAELRARTRALRARRPSAAAPTTSAAAAVGPAAAMVVLLDSKDEYTASHSAAVAMYCRDIALAIGLPEAEAEALHLAGLLHDLGKVGTPDAILCKNGPLNDEEWEFIRQHPVKGAEVLSHLTAYQHVAEIVRYHHERLDGSGYPDGARGEQIPELSKILAVADTYHAIASRRPYHDAHSSFEAVQELHSLAGKTLDRRYVEALADVLRDKDLAYRDGSCADFMGEYERTAGSRGAELPGAVSRSAIETSGPRPLAPAAKLMELRAQI